MAFTSAQYAALQAAIADGALTVRYADKTVTYRSLDEMVRILKMMENDLGMNANPSGRYFTQFGKGF